MVMQEAIGAEVNLLKVDQFCHQLLCQQFGGWERICKMQAFQREFSDCWRVFDDHLKKAEAVLPGNLLISQGEVESQLLKSLQPPHAENLF